MNTCLGWNGVSAFALPLIFAVGFTASHTAALAQGPPATTAEWVTEITNDREAAYQLITTGDLVGGASALVQSLHDLPPDYPQLIDSAYGSARLLQWGNLGTGNLGTGQFRDGNLGQFRDRPLNS